MAKKTPSNGTIKTQAISVGSEGEILDLIPKIMLFPGEDEATYLGLRQAFMADHSPGTPYETVIVENLVTLEWEAVRHRRIRDDLIRIRYRKYAVSAITAQKGGVPIVDLTHMEAVAFVKDLMGTDQALRADCLRTLEEIGVNEGEILAKAYQEASPYVEVHERKLAEIEVRRRRLREDYERLRAALIIPVLEPDVLDAEVLG